MFDCLDIYVDWNIVPRILRNEHMGLNETLSERISLIKFHPSRGLPAWPTLPCSAHHKNN